MPRQPPASRAAPFLAALRYSRAYGGPLTPATRRGRWLGMPPDGGVSGSVPVSVRRPRHNGPGCGHPGGEWYGS